METKQTDSKLDSALDAVESWRDAIDEADAAKRARLTSAWKEEIMDTFVEVLKECNDTKGLFLLHGQVEIIRVRSDKKG